MTVSTQRRIIPQTTVAFQMAPIPAGEFWMGSPVDEPGHQDDEAPCHRASVDAFWIQAQPVTWNEYQLFQFAQTHGLPSEDNGPDGVSHPSRPYWDMTFGMGFDGHPAVSMTQHAANKYAQWLSCRTGEFYRLPTEAEWEYACRAGSETPFFFGPEADLLSEYAWFAENSNGRTHRVGTKKPNRWGLYDMLGNVLEWTLDAYASYPAGKVGITARNPYVRPTRPYPMTVRGGCWADPALRLRCAARTPSSPMWKHRDPQFPKSIWHHTDAPWLGFRLVCPVQIPSQEEMVRYWNSGVAEDEE